MIRRTNTAPGYRRRQRARRAAKQFQQVRNCLRRATDRLVATARPWRARISRGIEP
jgi:hypothetical protein